MFVRVYFSTCLILCVLSSLRAAEPKDVTPDDPDVLVQGEYVGEVTRSDGKKKLGVQIVAIGKGKFHAVWRNGGLPGDGWDKNEIAPHEAQTTSGVTTFKADEQTATIKDGEMTLTTDGKAIGELKRIVRKSSTLGAEPREQRVLSAKPL